MAVTPEKTNREQIISLSKDVEFVKAAVTDLKTAATLDRATSDRRWDKVDNSIQNMNNSYPVLRNDINLINSNFQDFKISIAKKFDSYDTKIDNVEKSYDEINGGIKFLKVVGGIVSLVTGLITLYLIFNPK